MIALGLAAACSAEPRGPSPTPPLASPSPHADKVTQPMQGRLAQLQALIGSDQAAVIQRFAIPPDHVEPDVAYEAMKGVTRIHHPEDATLGDARLYFRAGKLALIYLSGGAGVEAAELDAAIAGSEPVMLRSRAGKTSQLRVYAGKGIAVSRGKQLDFVELFAPTTQADYEQSIYVAPPAFKL
jgi:hypothetical protein